MGQCMSWNKCKASCTSMGSSSYRWFHDGCCECVGSECQARTENMFGIDQSRCEECPILEDEDIPDDEMEAMVNLDYQVRREVVVVVMEVVMVVGIVVVR